MIRWIKRLFEKRISVKTFEALYSEYSKKMEEIDKERNFIYVERPRPEEQRMYLEKISMLSKDKFFLYWMSALQYKIIREFQSGGDKSPDFYRGQLSVISEMQQDSRIAAEELRGMAEPNEA